MGLIRAPHTLTLAAAVAAIAAALAAGAALAAQPASANALSFTPCAHIRHFECATLSVPLQRGGNAAHGATIRLHIARRLAGRHPSADAVVALAGGPGQAALPYASFMAAAMAPALRHRDLIVFDQRGTGESGPLHCAALEPSGQAGIHTLGQLVRRCAKQIGPGRAGYSSAESVQDIEAIRQAAGYEKLTLYGTSYGTKVALQYAETYPGEVEAMVLDSVVPPEGQEPFKVASFQAIDRVLAELCSHGACRHIAPRPLVELDSLAGRLRRRPLFGFLYNGSGKRTPSQLGGAGLFEILTAGDLNPVLRAMLPAAVHAALHRDAAPLLRLSLLSRGLLPSLPHGRHRKNTDQIDPTLTFDTTCEDTPYPWTRAHSPKVRLTEAFARLEALPASVFHPFSRGTAVADSLLAACAYWPYGAAAAPPPPGALPDVPTLILSGAQDLRTPTSDARKVAAAIPDSQLLVVPYTGHSVIGSDFGNCAKAAVAAFFAGETVQRCAPGADPFAPTPAIPRRLTQLHGTHGVHGRPGRTLRAALETISDLNDELIGARVQAQSARLPSGARFGGLRGGWAQIGARSVQLHRLTLVEGVQLTATLPLRKGRTGAAQVQITGRAAAHGQLSIGAGGRVSGVLGGRRFTIELARAHAAQPLAWAAHAQRARGRDLAIPAPARGQPGRLAALGR